LIKDGAIMVARRYQHLGHLGRFSTSSRRDAWCVRHGPQVQLRLHRSATRGSRLECRRLQAAYHQRRIREVRV